MWHPTLQSAEPAADRVRVHKHHGDRDRDGDGRVMREVASPVDGGGNVNAWHVVQQHASLQNDDAVIAQVQAILTEPKDALRDIPVRAQFGLDLDDAYAAGEAIRVPVRMHGDPPPLEARVVDTESGEELDRTEVADRNGDGPEAELRPLAAGTYRLIVDAVGVAPVIGVFAVLPRA